VKARGNLIDRGSLRNVFDKHRRPIQKMTWTEKQVRNSAPQSQGSRKNTRQIWQLEKTIFRKSLHVSSDFSSTA
jgi:hypothetical protein